MNGMIRTRLQRSTRLYRDLGLDPDGHSVEVTLGRIAIERDWPADPVH